MQIAHFSLLMNIINITYGPVTNITYGPVKKYRLNSLISDLRHFKVESAKVCQLNTIIHSKKFIQKK